MFFFNNCHSCCCNRQNDCVRCRPESECDCNAHNHCHANHDCGRCDCCRNRQNDCCRRPVCDRCKCCCCKCCHGIMPLGMNGMGNGGDCGRNACGC